MAYENEESNKQIVFTVDNESSMGELNERIKELEEVYRKAKTFDEITKLEKQTSLYSIVGKEDVELGTEIRKIINKYNDRYKERADNERS